MIMGAWCTIYNKFMIMGAWRTIYNKFLIGWVDVQYHWTLDSSCLYLARSSDSPKYYTDSSNITGYWTAAHPISNSINIDSCSH